MTGAPHINIIADRHFANTDVAMARFLEIANGLEADKGRISLGPINRTMLDEGASVAEYVAARDRAVAEGFVTMHQSGAYVMFTQLGAEQFA